MKTYLGGFYGSVISDFLLQAIGLISFLIIFNIFDCGLKIIFDKKIEKFISKIFFIFVYTLFATIYINISFNDSFWLID